MPMPDPQSQAPLELRGFIDNIPALAWTARPDGSVELFNQQFTDYSGWSPQQMYRAWRSRNELHRDDLERFEQWWQEILESRKPAPTEVRFRRADGEYRWFQISAAPIRDGQGNLVRWCGINIDIDDRKRAELELQQNEENLRRITQTIPGMLWSATPEGAVDYCNRPWLEFTSMTAEQAEGWGWAEAIHPDDRKGLVEDWKSSLASGTPLEAEARMRRFDGSFRWFLFRANALLNESGSVVKWYGTNIDIEDRKRREEVLQAAELSWRQIIDNIPGYVHTTSATGEIEFHNHQTLEYFGKTKEELKDWGRNDIVHPDDLPRVIEAWSKSIETGQNYEVEQRNRRADGVYRWFQARGRPVRNEEDEITAWYWLLTDIDDRKRAEQKVQKNEEDLRTILDAIRQAVVVLAADGTTLYANRVALEITGRTMEDVKNNTFLQRANHPDDAARLRIEREHGFSHGTPFELQVRMLHKNGDYRWYLNQYNPLRDEHGHVSRWYVTATDIDDQKRTEERLRNENLILREEIDRTSMFEEIVGSSEPMRRLLKQVEKVAPSDSSVLILGETGTGKELIARALHRRSKRAARAFVRVNCAAIPQSLIASELFGHEKGAFTGALQRRVGRFEAADGGTLFLDEVGELPTDTQISLLRVLQEREFERVGSNRPISIDIRVITATNRDLTAAVTAGTFRQDLFYRLNVFPIAVPPLRERAEDIPLLVEYFVGQFAKTSGKRIRHIGKDTLEMLREYAWPGNIRELQNVVERAVILTETDTFFVDENWLRAAPTESAQAKDGLSALADRELEMIEAALAECHGRIAGPSGAAAKLGIPRQTLESKVRRLGIDRYRHKRTNSL
jgi:formate hydrogenlyase transcriptional activator